MPVLLGHNRELAQHFLWFPSPFAVIVCVVVFHWISPSILLVCPEGRTQIRVSLLLDRQLPS